MPRPIQIPVKRQQIVQQFNRLMYDGSVLQSQNHVLKAEAKFRLAEQLFPQHPEPKNRLGLCLYQLKDFRGAVELLTKAIQIDSHNAEYLANRAAAYAELKQHELAVADCRASLAINPEQPEAWNNLAMILTQMDRLEEAQEAMDRYMKYKGTSSVANFNMGVLLQARGHHEAAIPYYLKTLELDPNGHQGVSARINLANGYKEMSDWDLATKWCQEALDLDSRNGDAWNVWGGILKETGKPNKSLDAFNLAAEFMKEKSEQFVYNRSLSELLIGRMPQAWMDFEHRWSVIPRAEAFLDRQPWQGEPIEDGTIVIHREQGQGDTIQFCRYIPLIKRANPLCKIIVICEPGLYDLMETLEGVDEVLRWGNKDDIFNVTYNFHCPMMSLPWAFKTTRDTIPGAEVVPYFNPYPERVAEWATRVDSVKINVGLVWSGGFREDQPKMWTTNLRRNCEFDYFATMVTTVRALRQDVVFHTLQKGDPAEQEFNAYMTANPGFPIENNSALLTSWMETAAYIDNLDLVVAVDTSTAHMAGARGKPVLLLNRMDTCWRWFLRGDTSPWYPGMEIFRQTKPKDWTDVVAQITEKLVDLPPKV